jgi:hypothetical protein
MAIADDLIRTTVRIRAVTEQGSASGTGFIFFFNEGGGKLTPALITNWHVVQGARETSFEVTHQVGQLQYRQPVVINNAHENWVQHPDGLDLAMLPIQSIAEALLGPDSILRVTALRMSDIADANYQASMTAVEDILMIGYPTGLWDSANNRPIARRGVTATAMNVDFEGRPEFVIDCACWPGSSGSPVFHYSRGTYIEAGQLKVGERFKLLGILHAGPQFTARGVVVEAPPASLAAMSQTAVMINLGYCIKATELVAFDSMVRELQAK